MPHSKVFPTLIGARHSDIVQKVKAIKGNVNSLGWMSVTLRGPFRDFYFIDKLPEHSYLLELRGWLHICWSPGSTAARSR